MYKYVEGQIQTLAVRNVNTSFNPIRGTLTKAGKRDLEATIEIVSPLLLHCKHSCETLWGFKKSFESKVSVRREKEKV